MYWLFVTGEITWIWTNRATVSRLKIWPTFDHISPVSTSFSFHLFLNIITEVNVS